MPGLIAIIIRVQPGDKPVGSTRHTEAVDAKQAAGSPCVDTAYLPSMTVVLQQILSWPPDAHLRGILITFSNHDRNRFQIRARNAAVAGSNRSRLLNGGDKARPDALYRATPRGLHDGLPTSVWPETTERRRAMEDLLQCLHGMR